MNYSVKRIWQEVPDSPVLFIVHVSLMSPISETLTLCLYYSLNSYVDWISTGDNGLT